MMITTDTNTTEEVVRRVFGKLNLGELEKIDIVPAQSRGMECLNIFIHYSTMDAVKLRERLDINYERQKSGEIVEPVNILFGWRVYQIYKCKTPMHAKHAETKESSVLIEM